MTRGKFAVILDNKLYMSIEFNGDMYPSYNGKLVYFLLNYVNTIEELISAIKFFDDHTFHYSEYWSDDTGCLQSIKITESLDFATNYISNFTADYLYIKNLDTVPYTIKNCLNKLELIQPGEIQVWHFGNREFNLKSELQIDKNDMARLGIAESTKRADENADISDIATIMCQAIIKSMLLLLKQKQFCSALIVTPVFVLDPKKSLKYKDLTLTWNNEVNNNFKINIQSSITPKFLSEMITDCLNAINSLDNIYA